jgi:16S rRNA (cytosine967-C5)-methyltransferase
MSSLIPRRAAHAAELLRLLAKSPQHPARLASDFLHGKKHLCADDRRIVSALAFAALRALPLLDACRADAACPGAVAPERARMAVLVVLAHAGVLVVDEVTGDQDVAVVAASLLGCDLDAARSWCDAVRGVHARLAAEASTALAADARTPIEFAAAVGRVTGTPTWMLEHWLRSQLHLRSASEVDALARSLMHAALPVLRVNTMRTSRSSVLERLDAAGIDAEPSAIAPSGIVLRTRARVTELDLYLDGDVEIQDEASQLAALAVDPGSGWTLLDACAGAGGKSLHLADLQGDRGRIVATDAEAVRLRSLAARAHRCGMQSIETLPLRALAHRHDVPSEFDAVLVDAPCSGTGTARRTPTALHRLTPRALVRYADRQMEILAEYARRVRVGGVLIYATCSLMPEENEGVVTAFLDAHPEFAGDPLAPVFAGRGVALPGLPPDAWHVTLSPATHGTDGFFIARMLRTH